MLGEAAVAALTKLVQVMPSALRERVDTLGEVTVRVGRVGRGPDDDQATDIGDPDGARPGLPAPASACASTTAPATTAPAAATSSRTAWCRCATAGTSSRSTSTATTGARSASTASARRRRPGSRHAARRRRTPPRSSPRASPCGSTTSRRASGSRCRRPWRRAEIAPTVGVIEHRPPGRDAARRSSIGGDADWIARFLAGLPFPFEVLDPPRSAREVELAGPPPARRPAAGDVGFGPDHRPPVRPDIRTRRRQRRYRRARARARGGSTTRGSSSPRRSSRCSARPASARRPASSSTRCARSSGGTGPPSAPPSASTCCCSGSSARSPPRCRPATGCAGSPSSPSSPSPLGALGTTRMTEPWQLFLLWGVVVGIGSGCMATVFASTVASRWFVARRGLVTGRAHRGDGERPARVPAAAVPPGRGRRAGAGSASRSPSAPSPSCPSSCSSCATAPTTWGCCRTARRRRRRRPRRPATSARSTPPSARSATPGAAATFWLLFGSFFVCGLSTNGLIQTHFVSAAHDHAHHARRRPPAYLALIGVFDVIGTIGSGWLTDRYDPRHAARRLLRPARAQPAGDRPGARRRAAPAWLGFMVFYGLDWVATVPPTVALCIDQFGSSAGRSCTAGCSPATRSARRSRRGVPASCATSPGSYRPAFVIAGVCCLVAAAGVTRIRHRPAPCETRPVPAPAAPVVP